MDRAAPGPPAAPTPPAFAPVADAWDCHVHVFGDPVRYAMVAGRAYTPGRAEPDDLVRVADALAIARVVLVQPSPYGTDNRCLLDALGVLGERAIGIVGADPDTLRHDATLAAWHGAGVRGVRLQLPAATAEGLSALHSLSDALAGTGWVLDLHAAANVLPAVLALAPHARHKIVLDHFGYALGRSPAGLDLSQLERLAAAGDVYVKASAPYRLPLTSEAAAEAVAALTERLPERCVWGSDWPHTPVHPAASERMQVQPFRTLDTGALANAALAGLSADARRRILSDTPRALFGPPR